MSSESRSDDMNDVMMLSVVGGASEGPVPRLPLGVGIVVREVVHDV